MSTNNLFPYEKELKDFVNSIDVSNIVSPATGNQTGIHNHFYGKKHTLETRKQISKSLTGHSSWNKGITGPDSHQYGEKNSFYGKKHSPERKAKQKRDPLTGRYLSKKIL